MDYYEPFCKLLQEDILARVYRSHHSGGIKSQLTLLLVTIATALAIFFIIAMLFPSNCMDTRNGEKGSGQCTTTLSIPVTK